MADALTMMQRLKFFSKMPPENLAQCTIFREEKNYGNDIPLINRYGQDFVSIFTIQRKRNLVKIKASLTWYMKGTGCW
jgi:hypothetical protein